MPHVITRHALRLLAALVLALFAWPAHANDWADIQAKGVLPWGGDMEGGGPYIFPDEKDPEKLIGFEIELLRAMGKFLHVKDEFTQAQWDKLPDMLRSKKVPLIANGLEYTVDRLQVMDATVPYFVYGLKLLCPRKEGGCRVWDDLKKPRDGVKQKIGVLTGSAAETEVQRFCGTTCEVVTYDGNTDSMREVETGKLDATVQDTPIASFYGPRFPQLMPVGKPVGRGYYVMYVRQGQPELLRKVNEALIVLVRSGELERICRRYGIWDDQQSELFNIFEAAKFYGLQQAVDAVPESPPGNAAAGPAGEASATTAMAGDATATTVASAATEAGGSPSKPIVDVDKVEMGQRQRGWAVILKYAPILAQSALMTIVLSILSFPLAILLGLLVAVLRLYGPRWLSVILTGYVEFLRGTPVMLQLYFIFFLLPELGINVPAFWTGVIGLAINYSAYESEIYRAGLQSVPPGQMEAALSLGMTRLQAIRRIVVPQAVRMVIPPVVSDFIALFKDTSVCSVVTVVELTKRFTVLSMNTQATVELMAVTAVLYLLMSVPVSWWARRLEDKLGVGHSVGTHT